MAIGFPPRAEKECEFDCSADDILDALENVLDELGWKFARLRGRRIQTSRGWSLWSHGELIEIEVERDGIVFISSKCSSPLQLFDWGRNQSNIDTIVARLKDELKG